MPEREVPLRVDPSRGHAAPRLELAQGAYYVATGLWPVVSPRTFQAVSGRKRDMWLAQTLGLVVATVGGVLVYSGARRRRPSEMALLGIGACAVLATSDLLWGRRKQNAWAYATDAAVELGLLAAWALGRGHLPWRRPGDPHDPASIRERQLD